MEGENFSYQMAEPHVVYASREGEPLESPKQPSSPEKVFEERMVETATMRNEVIADFLCWKDPALTGLIFGIVNIYFIVRQLVSDPLHWLLVLFSWFAFPIGYIAKALFHADQKTPLLNIRASTLSDRLVDEMKTLRRTLIDLFMWENPETSLKVVSLLFLFSTMMRNFGFSVTFNILLLLPLMVQHLPVDQMRCLTMKSCNVMSTTIQSTPIPSMNALFDWSQPRASVGALVAANSALLVSPVLFRSDLMAMTASLAAMSLLGAFVLKELHMDIGKYMGEPSQECQRQMKEGVAQMFSQSMHMLHGGYELMTWKQPKLSLIAFILAIITTSVITIVGTLPVAIISLNTAAILSHPAVYAKIKTA